MKFHWSIFVVLLTVLHSAMSVPNHRQYRQKIVIMKMNPSSQRVLDGEQTEVKAKRLSEAQAPFWDMTHTASGTFYFTNLKTNKILTYKEGFSSLRNKLVTASHSSDNSQQWYVNSDGAIVNVGDKKLAITMDIFGDAEVNRYWPPVNDKQKFQIYAHYN